MSKIEKKKKMNSSKSTEMSTGAQFNISTRRVQQHSTQLKRKNQIHFDRSIDSEWKENQIPKKEPVAGGPINVDFHERVGAVDDDAEPFVIGQHELLSHNMLIYKSVYVLTIFLCF